MLCESPIVVDSDDNVDATRNVATLGEESPCEEKSTEDSSGGKQTAEKLTSSSSNNNSNNCSKIDPDNDLDFDTGEVVEEIKARNV